MIIERVTIIDVKPWCSPKVQEANMSWLRYSNWRTLYKLIKQSRSQRS